jgi:hypothetical protein
MKVSRERIGGEIDLMLRSPDPVGAMRLLINLQLASTVFPAVGVTIPDKTKQGHIFNQGLDLLATAHDYLCDCKHSPPVWCQSKYIANNGMINDDISARVMLIDDDEARRVLWYGAFLKPYRDYSSSLLSPDERLDELGPPKKTRKANRSAVVRLLVDEIKRPSRDAENVERIMKAADKFTKLIHDSTFSGHGGYTSMTDPKNILLHGIFVRPSADDDTVECTMQRLVNGELVEEVRIDPETTDSQIWKDAMEYRWQCAEVLQQIQSLWRPALILSLAEQLVQLNFDLAIEEDVINQSQEEVRMGVLAKYDAFAASLFQLGLIGVWRQKPVVDGKEMKQDHALPNLPFGEIFRDVMNEQTRYMILHPGIGKESLIRHMRETYPYFT